MRDHAQQDEDAEINMTPMLDIVFIMLIFFIVTAAFVKEAGIQITKPEAAMSIQKPRTSIIIGISDAGEIWINHKKVDLKSVRPVLERLIAENPRGTVIIQADKDAKAGLTLDVLDAARAAKAAEVAISTRKPS
ncbi:MAG: biopolymer transporter ExbD [Proteobacteria bacterium]|nr:biopolymer transporter ExbD [Pseudomonadota bacterium]